MEPVQALMVAHGVKGKRTWMSLILTLPLLWELPLVHTEGFCVLAMDPVFKWQGWLSGGPKVKLVSACLCLMGLFLQQMGGHKSCISLGFTVLAKSVAALQWKKSQVLGNQHLLEELCWV